MQGGFMNRSFLYIFSNNLIMEECKIKINNLFKIFINGGYFKKFKFINGSNFCEAKVKHVIHFPAMSDMTDLLISSF